MLPLQQAFEVRSAIEEFLKATFVFREAAVQRAFYDFINDPEEGIFKGPYVSIKLPFVSAVQGAIPLDIAPDFPPYLHQFQSFQRLHTQNGHQPQPTLITTGTSSGKTESFLYPLLDYCYKHRSRRGIKAIILYPMNALATDQAKRLAEIIWNDERLQGQVTAGLFIGEGGGKKGTATYKGEMGATHIIESRRNIVANPPDILLTNFKMLDYGLMKGEYDTLWAHNYNDPALLQFLVLDELHTYDGAQGTDVANLIRRLKLKLNLVPGQLCPVGTSATIGSGANALTGLVQYASRVFGETIDETAVLMENRVELEDFLPEPPEGFLASFPHPNAIAKSKIGEHESYGDYLQKQKQLWQLKPDGDATELSEELKKLQIVKDLLSITKEGVIHFETLKEKLTERNTSFARLPQWDEAQAYGPRDQVLQSLIALVAAARTKAGPQTVPFLYVQVQVWIRELTGLLRKLTPTPEFTWKATGNAQHSASALPAWHCRECGGSGWLAVRHENKQDQLELDINGIYDHYFEAKKNLYFLNVPAQAALEEYLQTAETFGRMQYLEPEGLHLFDQVKEGRMQIMGYRTLQASNNNRCRLVCPHCNTEGDTSIIGTRIATMSSITVSQVLSSDLDPRNDKERKILAFTNSVQDAAHQAGFIEARNYRFTFRSSLQDVINSLSAPVRLTELKEQFKTYWKERADSTGANHTEAYVYRFFPADYRGRVNLTSDFRDPVTKQFKRHFLEELDHRITWEITSEFGYAAQIGRTLEKTGSSAVYVDPERVGAVYAFLQPWLQENGLAMLTEQDIAGYAHGLLQRLRIRGGVDHEYLEKYRITTNRRDLNWQKDSRHFLNKHFGNKTKMPRLLVTYPNPGGALDTTYTQKTNWYAAYYRKAFPMAPDNPDRINEFHTELVRAMEEAGLLDARLSKEVTNYVIRPDCLIVENEVSIYQCDECNSQLQTAASNPFAIGTCCLDYSCTGRYSLPVNNQLNYYQLVYNRARSPRIYASEHTGMLPRELREQVEYSFKERPFFNSLNTLVATSTLEMGINIGTLNAVMNNSVPPTTANFLQRVGRAGRSSGAALVTNFAAGQQHDLFHFEEPFGMMEGEVQTPGCYLEAKEILRRHFFAYCLDCWAKEDPLKNQLPRIIRVMSLMTADLQDQHFLINRILSFIKAHEQRFVKAFREIYLPDGLAEEVFTPLLESLRSDEWYRNIRLVFENLKRELTDLMQKWNDIQQQIKEKRLSSTDPEHLELVAEQRSLLGIRNVILKRSPVEHLTNRGYLPNYAFPETGVKLQANIRAYTAKGSEAPPVHEEFEIVRDAATALKELAPANDFYGLGYKFHISGLNTYDWNDASVLLTKRFCSNCDHIGNEALAGGKNCPKCGDPSWGADSNKHRFVKLNAVKSSNKRNEATLDDSNEQRKDRFYRGTRHLSFDEKTSFGAWGMKDIPFGIEYIRHVNCMEVNLGDRNAVHSNRIKINGEENVPRHGFITCRYCGKTAVEANGNLQTEAHYIYCKHKDQLYTGAAADPVFEEVFLYREMETEALKILLPVQEFDSYELIELFKAGIEAGLRLFYKGNPGHIGMWDYREFNKKSQRFDRYLVLFDTIPGGTGYLEKLFDVSNFSELIRAAYNHIKNCSCQHKGKQGCYRCIYTYRNQYVRESLNRAKAEELFEKIARRLGDWERYSEGLGNLSGNGQIEESELEDRFLRSLRNKVKQQEGVGWKWEERRDGVVRYFITLKQPNRSCTWQITPQVNLGPAQGVAFHTRADFQFSLVQATIGNEAITDAMYEEAPHWAIYLDGYSYHAQAENMRFYTDLARRQAIAVSGNYKTWTLTWRDLDLFDNNLKADAKQLADEVYPDPVQYQQSIQFYKNSAYGKYYSELVELKDNLERLLWMLLHPFKQDATDKKTAILLAVRQKKPGIPSFNAADLKTVFFGDIQPGIRATDPKESYMVSDLGLNADFVRFNLAFYGKSCASIASIYTKEVEGDLPKETWEQFWQCFNLVQDQILEAPEMEMESAREDAEQEILQYYDAELHEIVLQLVRAGVTVNPEGGFFLDEEDTPLAEAAVGSKEKKLFLQPISEEDRAWFLKAGYTEQTIETFILETWI